MCEVQFDRIAKTSSIQKDQKSFRDYFERNCAHSENADALWDYIISIQPFQRETISLNSRSLIQLRINNEEDFCKLRMAIGQYCLVTWPVLDKEFVFLDKLGKGS